LVGIGIELRGSCAVRLYRGRFEANTLGHFSSLSDLQCSHEERSMLRALQR
jgi:hypothetical protein